MVTPDIATSNFDWESFESPENIQSQSKIEPIQQESQEKEPENFQWGNYDSPDTYQGELNANEEDNLQWLVRNITANASRLGEQIVGLPGNLEQMGKDILTNMPSTGGILGYSIEKLVGPEKWKQIVNGSPELKGSQIFPQSKQVKKASEEVSKGYTKAKTKGEERFQETFEDVTSTLLTRRPVNFRNVAVNNLGIPIASNVVKNVVEDLGFGSDKATYSKLGTWTALSLLGNINAPQFASNLMNQGRNGIPTTTTINLPRFQTRLQNVANDPHLLHADPRSALARQQLAAIQNDLANGQTTVRSLMTTYDGINAAKRNRSLFELNKNDQAFARRAIDRVRDAVRDEIMDAGAAHPQALESWRNGIQAWSVIHQSRGITNWIESIAKGPYSKILSGPAAGLFGVSSYGAFKAPIIAGPLTVATPAAYKTIQTAYRVWQDERLAQYYWNSIRAAQTENLPAFLNNYNKLNEKLDSTEKKSKSKK